MSAILIFVILVSGDLGCEDCVRVDVPQAGIKLSPISVREVVRVNVTAINKIEHGLTVPLDGAEGPKFPKVSVFTEAQEQKINDFVARNEEALGIEFDDLVLQSTEDDNGLWKAFYTQEYEGIPVHDSLVSIVVDSGRVVKTKTKYHANISAPTMPQITLENAIQSAKNELGVDDEPLETKLLIYPYEEKYYLVWEFAFPLTIEGNAPHGWVAYVGAQTGEIIHYYDSIVYDIQVNGTVTGLKYYPVHPNQTQKAANFTNGLIFLLEYFGDVFHTRTNSTAESYMVLKEPLNLSNATSANLSFRVERDWGCYWVTCSNHFYAEASNTTDNESWQTIINLPYKDYTFEYSAPLVYNLSQFLGQERVYLRFRGYSLEERAGLFLDNITVTTNNGVVFFDSAENTSNWNATRFWITPGHFFEGSSTATNENGSYRKTASKLNETVLYFNLWGDDVSVLNFDTPHTLHLHYMNESGTYNWTINDTSDRQEESNVYYHVTRAQSFFNPYVDVGLGVGTYVGFGDNFCNAFYYPTLIKLYFGDGQMPGCENLALGSDIILHEFTHRVVHAVYGSTPTSTEFSAMNEGWADYFACSMNNESRMGDGIYFNNFSHYIRDLNNTFRYPDDWSSSAHNNSRMFSGALWDTRALLGIDETDNLTMLAMKLKPESLSEFLGDTLTVNDDNANLSDGTPNATIICQSFYDNHGIYNKFCAGYTKTSLAFIDNTDNEVFEKGSVVAINGTAAPSADNNVTYRVEVNVSGNWTLIGEGNATVSEGSLVSWNTTGYAYGNYTIRLSVNDTSGNTSEEVFGAVLADITNPTIHSTSASPDPVEARTQLNLSANVTDNDVVASVIFQISGENLTAANNGGIYYNNSWDTNTTVGFYTVTVFVLDNSNNSANSTFNFTVHETVPPVVLSHSSEVSQTTANLSIGTNEQATCRYSGSQGIAFENMTDNFTSTNSTTHWVYFSGLSHSTTYHYYVRCKDVNDNIVATDYAASFTTHKPKTGGGGGGGGGSVPRTPKEPEPAPEPEEEPEVIEVIEPSREPQTYSIAGALEQSESQTLGLEQGDSAEFLFEEQTRSITLDSVTSEGVIIETSAGLKTIPTGGEVHIDLNGDGEDDVSITAESTGEGRAEITVTRLWQTQKAETGKATGFWLLGTGGTVAAVVGLLVFLSLTVFFFRDKILNGVFSK